MTRGVRNDPPELKAGFAHKSKGAGVYVGVLRAYPSARPSWTCSHSHLTPIQADWCSKAELARRTAGEREVFTLLWCEPCGSWWTPAQATGGPQDGRSCPRCGVPLEAVKLVVLERRRVS